MKSKPHPRFSNFKDFIDASLSHVTPLKGIFIRIAGPSHTTAREILSGEGAFRAGGRWNSVGVMKIVYASMDPVTATYESTEHLRYYGIPLWNGMPRVMVGITVELEKVLDLTNPTVEAAIPGTMATLMAEDWRSMMNRGEESSAQAMGRAAFEAKIEGLIVPSRPHAGGRNLLVFPDQLGAGSVLKVLNPALLERLGKPG